MKERALVIFSSLPEVGGHTTTTLKLCELLRPMFSDIRVLIKDIPGHGFSPSASDELLRMGVRATRCPGRNPRDWCRLLGGRGKPDVFLAIGMRHLSPVLALLLGARQSFYYHITHELSPSVLRQLRIYGAVFSKLVFISPATAQRYQGPAREPAVWALQPTEFSLRPGLPIPRSPGVARFGFLGRMTGEKGIGLLADLIEKNPLPCELHIAGRGPQEEAMRHRQAKHPDRFFLHGAFTAGERTAFLSRFFSGIDWLCVPSLDDREGIPNVILEALQFGVPVLATRSGGVRSFVMDELGPAAPDVIRLIEPRELSGALSSLLATPPPTPALRKRCREYFERFFSDAVLAARWRSILTIPAG